MKVKCIKLLKADGKEVEFSPSLTLGKEYHVLSISYDSYGKLYYRIVTSEREGKWPHMSLHSEKCFELVTTFVPSSWHLKIYQNKGFSIGPKTWINSSFYENFYDGEPSALHTFYEEYKKILSEEP
ncbi:hypothetical protein WJT86_12035 [Microvirga sp. W0021]|uniref:Uncharacterized protein n=1 Tax=Hohaiivirga grylli TaxID=3133970 RepID=A0ABV0BLD0_9HYPH